MPPHLLVDLYLEHRRIDGIAVATAESYRAALYNLHTWLQARGRTYYTATQRDLCECIASLAHLSGATVARNVVVYRMFWRWGLDQGHFRHDAAALLERPRQWSRVPTVLSRDQAARLVTAPSPPALYWVRDRALLELLYGCGLRASEACAITGADLLWGAQCIRVRGKGGRERLVPLAGQVEVALRRLEIPASGPILVSRTGRPLERVAVWNIVRKWAKFAGLRAVHPHALRHSFATHMLEGGADLRAIQAMMGHASLAMTQGYTRIDRARMLATIRAYHPRG